LEQLKKYLAVVEQSGEHTAVDEDVVKVKIVVASIEVRALIDRPCWEAS